MVKSSAPGWMVPPVTHVVTADGRRHEELPGIWGIADLPPEHWGLTFTPPTSSGRYAFARSSSSKWTISASSSVATPQEFPLPLRSDMYRRPAA